MADVCRAVEYASGDTVTFKSQTNALSFSNCQGEIDDSDPFVIWLQGKDGSASHVIVAFGYKTGSTNYLNILDPSPSIIVVAIVLLLAFITGFLLFVSKKATNGK